MKITILIGKNIVDLQFQQGGSSTLGLTVDKDWGSSWIYSHQSTSRKCPEDGKHPQIYRERLTEDLKYCTNHWNYIVSTNSMHTINIVSDFIREGLVCSTNVEVIALCPENKSIIFKAGFDKEGYLDENWQIGFLSI